MKKSIVNVAQFSAAVILGAATAVVLIPQRSQPITSPKTITLSWSYVANSPQNESSNITFNVFRSDVPANFAWWADVRGGERSLQFQPTGEAGFFMIRASNNVTHVVGDWGTR